MLIKFPVNIAHREPTTNKTAAVVINYRREQCRGILRRHYVELILLYECTALYPRFYWMETEKFTGVKILESASQM